MKIVILLSLIFLGLPSGAQARPEFICSLYHAKRVIALASSHSTYDKNRHCSVSCMLALKCVDAEVMMIGYLKEFEDVFTPGDCDVQDLKADAFGISLSAKGAATTDKECLSQCDLYYHQ